MSRRTARLAIALLFAGIAAVACDLYSEAESKTVMVSELLTTPAETVAGVTVSSKVLASVYLVTVPSLSNLSSLASAAPALVTGANVTVEFNGNTVTLTSTDAGLYYVDNVGDPSLEYHGGANYRFAAQVNGQTYSQIVNAPEQESITEFHAGLTPYTLATFDIDAGGLFNVLDAGNQLLNDLDGGFIDLPDGGKVAIPVDAGSIKLPGTDAGALSLSTLENLLNGSGPGYVPITPGQDLVLHRANAINGTPTLAAAFVLPFDVNFSSPTAFNFEPTAFSYTSPQFTPQGLLTLIFAASQYETSSVTIQGEKAWPACPPNDFVLLVAGLKAGFNEGSNLFPGSTAFAGSADAAPAHCAN